MRSCVSISVTALLLWPGGPAARVLPDGRSETGLSNENPWSVLWTNQSHESILKEQEAKMTTVSLVMALLALAVSVATLLWCQRVVRRVIGIEQGSLAGDERQRLLDAADRFASLQTQVDHLRDNLEDRLHRSDAVIGRVEGRLAEIEKSCGGLGPIARDLDGLKSFQNRVEQIHNRVLKAFNGDLAQIAGERDAVPGSISEPGNA
jgi:methyl-accepting chemotaxis protein